MKEGFFPREYTFTAPPSRNKNLSICREILFFFLSPCCLFLEMHFGLRDGLLFLLQRHILIFTRSNETRRNATSIFSFFVNSFEPASSKLSLRRLLRGGDAPKALK